MEDGPLGVRFADLITAFPAGITTGATFNEQLMLARGQAMGQEFRGKGVNMALSPCVGPLGIILPMIQLPTKTDGIGKFPLGGRNWEGKLGKKFIHETFLTFGRLWFRPISTGSWRIQYSQSMVCGFYDEFSAK